jgi:hypothetical protein
VVSATAVVVVVVVVSAPAVSVVVVVVVVSGVELPPHPAASAAMQRTKLRV